VDLTLKVRLRYDGDVKTFPIRLSLPPETDAVVLCRNRGHGLEPFSVRAADQIFVEELRTAATDKKAVAGAVAGIVEIYAIPFRLSEFAIIFTNSKKAMKTGGLLCGSKTSPARGKHAATKNKRNAPKSSSAAAPNAEPSGLKLSECVGTNSALVSA